MRDYLKIYPLVGAVIGIVIAFLVIIFTKDQIAIWLQYSETFSEFLEGIYSGEVAVYGGTYKSRLLGDLLMAVFFGAIPGGILLPFVYINMKLAYLKLRTKKPG